MFCYFIRLGVYLVNNVSFRELEICINKKKKECMDDMVLWLVFLDNYNGKIVF